MHHRDREEFHMWSHDHESAHRQLLLDRLELAFVILFTESGPALWINYVLLYDSTGAGVWTIE